MSSRSLRTLNPQPSTLNPSRRGVTLVELLITIMIISILAAAVLGVAAVAGETAREAKTRSIISRIHTLLMEQYDTYANRRVKVKQDVTDAITNLPPASYRVADKGRLKAEARLYALREMMMMEVPDRWSDILFAEVPTASPINAYPVLQPIYLEVPSSASGNNRTEIANVYLRHFDRITKATNKITGNRNTRNEILDNQGAECLYLIVMNACGDGESRTLFPESSIGDTDGDGALEFIDGWGHPIELVRWAPGFESDIQLNADELDAATDAAVARTNAGAADHDPFDLYRTAPMAYRLVPLIYSSGRDEEAGLYSDPADFPWRPTSYTLQFMNTGPPPYVRPALSPHRKYSQYLGSVAVGDKSATDNLHNHLIGTR